MIGAAIKGMKIATREEPEDYDTDGKDKGGSVERQRRSRVFNSASPLHQGGNSARLACLLLALLAGKQSTLEERQWPNLLHQ